MLYHICKIAFSPLCSLSLCSFGVFQSVQNKRPGNAGYPLPDPLRLKTQFRYLLPLEDVFLIYDSILMVMAEKPVGEFTPLADHFKKVRQFIRSIGWIDLLHHTAGSAVGENTVYRPVDSFQVCQGFLVFRLAGHFLGPPTYPLDPKHGSHPAHQSIPVFEVRIGWIENSILNIMGGRTAHCEPGEAAEVEDLSPHKVQDMLLHHMDPSAIPFFFW